MGNAVVERASLPMGYVPIGVKEYNGVVYVVAYNPLAQRVQFGSFPSPEIDFDGSDFDPEEYQLEGVTFLTPDFYTRNKRHQSYFDPGVPQIDSDFEEQIADTLIPQDSTEDAYNPAHPFDIMYWEDNGDGIPNEYDGWTIETDAGEPKFVISKAELIDSFESYEWLKLNSGDRFLIYYIDLLESDDYSNVTEILKHYLSVPNEKKLFRVEVYSVSPTGRKIKLNINPFLYTKDDVSINILNGDLGENVQYTVFDGESNSTIEVRIGLEKPESFRASFRQFSRSGPTVVRFRTFASSSSFMQIKGFRYKITKRLQEGESFSSLWGYMRYTSDALYDERKQTFYTQSYAELLDLPEGVYDYVLTPFTQYGYELGMVVRGSFDVSNSLILDDSPIELQLYNWSLQPQNVFQLEFQVSYELAEGQSVTEVYAEFYDVWSNVSSILELTDVDGVCAWSDGIDLTLQSYPKNKTFNETEFGGIPIQEVTTDQRAKLPKRGLSYQKNNVALKAPFRLQQNRFYVFAVYYTIEDSFTEESFTKGIYRYLYTNDAFNSFSDVDFSNSTYPSVDINLVKEGVPIVNKPEYNNLAIYDVITDEQSYMFDPLLQTYNFTDKELNPVVKTPYLVQPKFYKDQYYANSNFKINYSKSHWFQVFQRVTNPIVLQDHIGEINYVDFAEDTNVFTTTKPQNGPLTADQNRTVQHMGGSAIAGEDVFGECEPQPMIYQFDLFNDKFNLRAYQRAHKVHSSVVYDYSETAASYTYHINPIFYLQAKEIRDRILSTPSENINMALANYSANCQMEHLPHNFDPSIWPLQLRLNVNQRHIPLNQNLYTLSHSPLPYGRFDVATFHLRDNASLNNLGISRVDIGYVYDPNNYTIEEQNQFQAMYTNTFRDDQIRFSPFLAAQYHWVGSAYYTGIQFVAGERFMDGVLQLNTRDDAEELVNFVIFSGSVTDQANVSDTDRYYRYVPESSKYTYESGATSRINYEQDVNFTYKVHDRQCYRIHAPAMTTETTKTIILDDHISNYIMSKFEFDLYDGSKFLPKQTPTTTKSLSFELNVSLSSGLDAYGVPTNDDLYNAPMQAANHPLFDPTQKYTFVGETNQQMFHLKNSDSGIMQVTNQLLRDNILYYDNTSKKVKAKINSLITTNDPRLTIDTFNRQNEELVTLQYRYNLDN